ncbi:hypothetical protein BG006_007925 [Podila minutissima]|uniref:Uncharacterized protein n=1 Tax=Podila minutissima TaxID=64525 RepID=A0A9P5SJ32_9FUNG|nr:hypothetical protein BG006_007925 [Podila minutissima]
MATLTKPKGSKRLSDWRHSLNAISGTNYFKEKIEPHEITFAGFIHHIQPTSTKECEVEALWSLKILPAIQKSAFQRLRQQFPRLQREWSLSAATRAQLWEDLAKSENATKVKRLQEANLLQLREESTTQLAYMAKKITYEVKEACDDIPTARRETEEYDSNDVGDENDRYSEAINNDEGNNSEPVQHQVDKSREQIGEDEDAEDLTQVASMSPFTRLIGELFRKYGHPSPKADLAAPTQFSSIDVEELYTYSKRILDSWSECSIIEQKNCLVALSGIINALDKSQEPFFSSFDVISSELLDKDLFVVTESQKAIYARLKTQLGQGTMPEVKALRRFCMRRSCDLEELCEEGGALKTEELKIMEIMEIILKEIVAMKCVPNPTETEYVFPWREITRVLFNSDMVARVGELGSSSTRQDRTKLERDNKGAESNVRSRKIDMLHQLYIPTRTTPLELVSWEAKSETASSTVLQCQLRKNIRINVSIQKQLQQYPDSELWTSPVVLDICGPKALAYTVLRIEKDLFVVGAVGDTLIELPRFEEDIHEFFDSGSLSALLRIGNRNTLFANNVKIAYKQYAKAEKMNSMLGRPLRSSTQRLWSTIILAQHTCRRRK